MKCYNCGSTNTYTKNNKNNFTINEENISFISKRRFCHDCGKVVYDRKLDNETSKTAIETFNKKKKIIKDYEFSEYNGFTPLSIEKIKNVILFLANDTVPKTKLLKEMFYSDFYNYKNTTTSITGLEYVKLPYGPVPDDFDTIINLLYKENLIDYKIKYINDESECHLIKSKKEFDKEIFDNEELEVLEKIKTYFKNYTTREIVEKSHQEKAYLKTKEKKKIDYEFAFDIEL